MKINDLVYGEFEINEPVLVDLINSKPLQRIKAVNQAGSQLVEPHRNITRYDHCVGVMLLLRNFNATLEEQVAGLLHDVPHTAFSHAVDFAFGEEERQTYHERFLKKIVLESEIPEILTKHDIDPERVTDEHNFGLLEQDIPDLCADRIDYSLRDTRNYDGFTQKEVEDILASLITLNGKFVLTDKQTALIYARAFMKTCLEFWNSPKTLAALELMGDLLRTGLEMKIISEEDLFLTDDELIRKISSSIKPETSKFLEKLTPRLSFTFDEDSFDYHTKGKIRYIDPLIYENNKLTRLSELKEDFATEIEDFKKKVKKGYKIRIDQYGPEAYRSRKK